MNLIFILPIVNGVGSITKGQPACTYLKLFKPCTTFQDDNNTQWVKINASILSSLINFPGFLASFQASFLNSRIFRINLLHMFRFLLIKGIKLVHYFLIIYFLVETIQIVIKQFKLYIVH